MWTFVRGTLPVGSSPLTRGKPMSAQSTRRPARLIPAHAGKTLVLETPVPVPGAHPRSRGENVSTPILFAQEVGSSPLTRGKPDNSQIRALSRGLIPAHAGKTSPRRNCQDCKPAHPRSRGENVEASAGGRVSRGSSPLTRGKRTTCGTTHPASRLIPAHAGKTRTTAPVALMSSAHPRSRGENPIDMQASRRAPGSSPLTRGKRLPGLARDRDDRLIPAHAGKTEWITHWRPLLRAHPRSRGENAAVTDTNWGPNGSSPLTRGKPIERFQDVFQDGLIPAHAGKTSS